MSWAIGSIYGELELRTAQFSGAIRAATKMSSSFTDRMSKQVTSIGVSLDRIGKSIRDNFGAISAVGGAGLSAGIGGLAAYSVKLAANAEQAQVAFTTMLGSAEAAGSMMQKLNQFAAETPFETTELIVASRKLLAFGTAHQEIIPTMRRLGDIAAGLNIPLGELSEIYGKARVQGTLFAEDINQLTGRGIPIIQEFARQMGVTEAEVKQLASQGKVSFANLHQALVSLTSQGGKFAGLMAAQSHTLSGLFSTLADNAKMKLTEFGQTLVKELDLKQVVADATQALEKLSQAVAPVVVDLVKWTAAHKDLLIKIGGTAAAVGAVAIALPPMVSIIKAATAATVAFSTASKAAFANPVWAAAAVAVGGFTAVMLRSVSTNEKWAESAYNVMRALGQFDDPVQNLGVAMEELGKARSQVQSLALDARQAVGLDDAIVKQRALVDALEAQHAAAAKVMKLQEAAQRSDIHSQANAMLRANMQRALDLASQRGEGDDVKQLIRQMFETKIAENQKAIDAIGGMNVAAIRGIEEQAKRAKAWMEELVEAKEAWGEPGSSSQPPTALTEFPQIMDLVGKSVEERSKEMGKAFDRPLSHAEQLRKTLDELKFDADTAGLSAIEKQLAEFRRNGMGEEMIREAAKSLQAIDDVNIKRNLQGMGEQLAKELMTPMEQYEQQITQLDKLRNAGAIDAETYARGVRKARADLEGPVAGTGGISSLVAAGSQEAFRLQAENFAAANRGSQKIPAEQLAVARSQESLLEQIADRLPLFRTVSRLEGM